MFADEGFVVLIQIIVGNGSPQREAYVVGCSTEDVARDSVRRLYANEPNVGITVSPLGSGDARGLRLAFGEVRLWR